MPEAHLSKEQAQAFRVLVRENKDSITRVKLDHDTEGYTVGIIKAPMFIVFDTHIEHPGEANLYYPTVLESKLAESGVIFEQDKIEDNLVSLASQAEKPREYAPGINPSEW